MRLKKNKFSLVAKITLLLMLSIRCFAASHSSSAHFASTHQFSAHFARQATTLGSSKVAVSTMTGNSHPAQATAVGLGSKEETSLSQTVATISSNDKLAAVAPAKVSSITDNSQTSTINSQANTTSTQNNTISSQINHIVIDKPMVSYAPSSKPDTATLTTSGFGPKLTGPNQQRITYSPHSKQTRKMDSLTKATVETSTTSTTTTTSSKSGAKLSTTPSSLNKVNFVPLSTTSAVTLQSIAKANLGTLTTEALLEKTPPELAAQKYKSPVSASKTRQKLYKALAEYGMAVGGSSAIISALIMLANYRMRKRVFAKIAKKVKLSFA